MGNQDQQRRLVVDHPLRVQLLPLDAHHDRMVWSLPMSSPAMPTPTGSPYPRRHLLPRNALASRSLFSDDPQLSISSRAVRKDRTASHREPPTGQTAESHTRSLRDTRTTTGPDAIKIGTTDPDRCCPPTVPSSRRPINGAAAAGVIETARSTGMITEQLHRTATGPTTGAPGHVGQLGAVRTRQSAGDGARWSLRSVTCRSASSQGHRGEDGTCDRHGGGKKGVAVGYASHRRFLGMIRCR